MGQYVVWLPQGRLGNLLFQMQAIKYHFPKARIVISPDAGYSDIFIKENTFTFIKVPRILRARFLNLWANIFRGLVTFKLFSSLKLKPLFINGYMIESDRAEKIPGFFQSIWVIEGWFQSPFLLDLSGSPTIKREYVDSAHNILSEIPAEKRIGLHMRFGDFEDWSILGKKGVSLPVSYYFDAIKIFDSLVDSPKYIIFSDDLSRARTIFGDLDKYFYFDGRQAGTDLAGMSLCSHGILSASTFALWGFNLTKNKKKKLIFPKYWAGFRSEIWYPPEFELLEGVPIEVNAAEKSL